MIITIGWGRAGQGKKAPGGLGHVPVQLGGAHPHQAEEDVEAVAPPPGADEDHDPAAEGAADQTGQEGLPAGAGADPDELLLQVPRHHLR